MFTTMNQKEMMKVNGGFYYVPSYKDGVYQGLTQIPSCYPGVKKVVDGKYIY
jgi:bacteriocin-like protein